MDFDYLLRLGQFLFTVVVGLFSLMAARRASSKVEAEALAQRLASGPTLAYGAMKRLMRASMDHTLPDQLAAEKDAFVQCAGTEDFRAGVEAFHLRQSPQFVGR